MCGTIGARSWSTVPGHWSRPSARSPCSLPAVHITCMPTQMPSTGRPPARRRSTIRGPPTARRPRITEPKAPTPGTTSPSAAATAAGSAVSSTSAPARSRARTAERTLPEPWSRTTTVGWLVTAEVYRPWSGTWTAQPLGEHPGGLPAGQVARTLVPAHLGDRGAAQDEVLHDVVGPGEHQPHRQDRKSVV